ncbi:MAG: hypothetical protein HON04_06675 [Planctomicrobium sp.]|nr:hypothetical protein [Planctomicrobium sp.]
MIRTKDSNEFNRLGRTLLDVPIVTVEFALVRLGKMCGQSGPAITTDPVESGVLRVTEEVFIYKHDAQASEHFDPLACGSCLYSFPPFA